MSRNIFCVLLAGSIAALTSPLEAQSQRPARPPERPLPAGQEIYARDGDRVIIEDDARVRVITRRTGFLRTVFNAEQRWLIVMVDSTSPETGAPDGKPDVHFTLNGLEGEWPLDSRWEGYGAVDQEMQSGQFRPTSLNITTPVGVIQLIGFLPPSPADSGSVFRDPSARAVLTHRGFGTGSGGFATFDQLEQNLGATATRNAQGSANPSMRPGGGVVGGISPMPGTVRAGANVASPRKILDVPPAYPVAARQARISGTVILEATIGQDGSVSNLRVLRSIPMLDQAALEAVRQWRYEPTIVNGVAVPLVLTIPVQISAR